MKDLMTVNDCTIMYDDDSMEIAVLHIITGQIFFPLNVFDAYAIAYLS